MNLLLIKRAKTPFGIGNPTVLKVGISIPNYEKTAGRLAPTCGREMHVLTGEAYTSRVRLSRIT